MSILCSNETSFIDTYSNFIKCSHTIKCSHLENWILGSLRRGQQKGFNFAYLFFFFNHWLSCFHLSSMIILEAYLGQCPFRLGTSLVTEGLKVGINPFGEALLRCLGCPGNRSQRFHLQAGMRSEDPCPFSLATMGFCRRKRCLLSGVRQIIGTYIYLFCINLCEQLSTYWRKKKFLRNFEILKYHLDHFVLFIINKYLVLLKGFQ